MKRGMRADLHSRFELEHERGRCVVAESASEGRRLRYALQRGEVMSPAPRLFALPSLWNTLDQQAQAKCIIRSLSHLHPSWVFGSFSAALVHGLYVSNNLLSKVYVVCSPNSHTRSNQRIARQVIGNYEVVLKDGIPVTPLDRTAFDCMRLCSFPAGLAVADSALRVSGMTSPELVDRMEQLASNQRNAWRPAGTAALANPLSENGGESVTRASMISHGFMLPQLQKEIPNPVDEGEIFRVDFYWELPGGNVAGELDGREKYVNPSMTKGRSTLDVMANERLRESRLTGANTKVMRFSYADVMRPQRFCHLLDSFGIPRGFEVPRVALA